MSEFLLIGVGNPYRRDDAIGLLAVRAVEDRLIAPFRQIQTSGEGTEIMQLLESAQAAIIVDAVNSGAFPGTIHSLDASSESIPSDFFNYSTHAFSVAEAIEMMRVLGTLPPHVVLVGMEGADFSAGEGLSEIVEGRFEALLDAVEKACSTALQTSATSF